MAITVVKATGRRLGENVGRINATGRDLGNVSIQGDLGDLDVGAAGNHGTALASLKVNSLGKAGLVSQGGGGGLNWAVNGSVGPVTVKTDVQNVDISIYPGNLASLTIGGSLLGGTTNFTGYLDVNGGIGPVSIGKDVIGGSAAYSAYVSADNGDIASIKIGGSFKGGGDSTHSNSGYFYAAQAIPGGISIKGDMIGGNGSYSAYIDASATATSGTFPSVGRCRAAAVHRSTTTPISMPTITSATSRSARNLAGGAANYSAYIYAGDGNMGDVLIKGSVTGGAGTDSAYVFAELQYGQYHREGRRRWRRRLRAVPISRRTMARIGAVTIGGSLKGGDGSSSGYLYSYYGMGAVHIAKDFIGGTGSSSGYIYNSDYNTIESIFHRRRLQGRFRRFLRLHLQQRWRHWRYHDQWVLLDRRRRRLLQRIHPGLFRDRQHEDRQEFHRWIWELMRAPFTTMTMARSVMCNDRRKPYRRQHGSDSAYIFTTIMAPSRNMTIGGSMLGGNGSSSAYIYSSYSSIGAIKIGKDFKGGGGDSSGYIYGDYPGPNGYSIQSITIGGSFIGGSNNYAGFIDAGRRRGDRGPASKIRPARCSVAPVTKAPIFILTPALIPSPSARISSGALAAAPPAISITTILTRPRLTLRSAATSRAAVGPIPPPLISMATTARLEKLVIKGSVIGGSGGSSAYIEAYSGITSIAIGKDFTGGSGSYAGYIYNSYNGIGSITIGGNFAGGSATGALAILTWVTARLEKSPSRAT